MTTRESGTGRRSVDDWIQAGYTILAEEGIGALKIDRLCQRLGVTKGSFYWHFTDMAGYRTALIESWAQQRGEEHRVYHDIDDKAPAERLSILMTALVAPRHWKLERTMREWARTDAHVAASVDEADRRVLHTVRKAFLDLGFPAEEADLRAHTTFAAGIGFLQIAGQKTSPLTTAQRDRFLQFMLRP
ncbi:TetR/AcrR family transcriptional regulator [Mycolicibacterium confluentis]|uniref:TetR/AcrR family transcriptional regulator n=1 Tax=Mycolicibacterium confluentis TaxID=28047 RepID=UPI000A158B68|nr:TetR/AcrR family transcriptional regulator [Mycolicibacterium confluentis]MCV7319645.1 TetR/AcrR family transcriptional regulator [Mycolicibacterium confluentis]ORV34246.1 TetR family transcriptional regulator [Mycolicibacterium confluentis]